MFYDSFAKRKRNKLGAFLNEKVWEMLVKTAAAYDPEKILEIGIGRGGIYEKLKEKISRMEYTGIEASDICYEEARKKGINAIKCFVPPFPQELERGTFDMIIMSHVLEHFVDYKEVLGVLDGMNSLLKPGGKVILFHPDARDWGADFYECDYSHSYFTTRNRVDNLLHDTGFRIIRRDSYRACFKHFRWLFWIISRAVRPCHFLRVGIRITFNKNLLTVAEKLSRD